MIMNFMNFMLFVPTRALMMSYIWTPDTSFHERLVLSIALMSRLEEIFMIFIELCKANH